MPEPTDMARDNPATTSDWTPNPTAHTLSLPEQIAERIGNDIIQGRFERGHRIQEQDIAAQFQVSRGPVREALRILERDGLLQINARRGAQVTELSVAELNGIFDARISLSGLAARRAAERRDAATMPRLKAAIELVSSLAPTADTDTFVKAVYVAHQIVCEASGNPFLTRLVFQATHQTLRYSRLGLSTPKRRQQSGRNWRRLWAAIQGGKASEAQQAAEQLVSDSRDTAVKLLSQEQASQPPASSRRRATAAISADTRGRAGRTPAQPRKTAKRS